MRGRTRRMASSAVEAAPTNIYLGPEPIERRRGMLRYACGVIRRTNADLIVQALRGAGVERLFGMPGGGSNADLIEAARRAGLPFTLAHTEAASAFMAAAQAEITGKPGACIATLGPGAASLMNGLAHAFLDRVPLIAITDCHGDPAAAGVGHQALAQSAMFRPVVKFTARLERGSLAGLMAQALASAVDGPVHLDVSAEVTAADAEGEFEPICAAQRIEPLVKIDARRPVLLIGLRARTGGIAEDCERFRIPALVTYKAKGVVPDRHPWFGGVLTNGTLEREILERGDVFIAVGLDEVELLPRPWVYRQPMIHVAAAGLHGALTLSDWDEGGVRCMAERQRQRMRVNCAGEGMPPHRVVEQVAEVYAGARVTVDAGAHMFPVMSLWPAAEPRGLLISNGLSTMGFALPAAIGAALLDRPRPVVAFTGDGGLLMCTGELRTAAREALPLRIIVFEDGELSLIKVKQVARGYSTDGLGIGGVDWPALAEAFGVTGRRASDERELRTCLCETAKITGPVLIAARVNARAYEETIRVLRG
jgi:acetolactate synthase I/II/III large subunit